MVSLPAWKVLKLGGFFLEFILLSDFQRYTLPRGEKVGRLYT